MIEYIKNKDEEDEDKINRKFPFEKDNFETKENIHCIKNKSYMNDFLSRSLNSLEIIKKINFKIYE